MTAYARHKLDIYGADLYLATTKRQWRALAKHYDWLGNVPESAGQATFATWERKGHMTVPIVVLWLDLKQHNTTTELIDTIAHEASHAAGRILEHIGHSAPTDEPSAYLIGWLSGWMWEHVPSAWHEGAAA